jgi:RNA polymerase sigma-70 factor (ECF subfamily)
MVDERRAGNDPPPSDRSLLRRFRDGDEDAATELYVRYAHRLRALARAQCSAGLARRVEVEDLVQSVFGSFFRGVRRGYYDVPDGEELWKLFLVIALNKIRLKGLFYRAAKRDVRRTVGGDRFEQAMGEAMGRDAGACTFLQLVINEALEPLPEPQKQMILLRIEGHEVAEIARQTERSKRTVERTLQRFRQQMADLLEVEG